MCGQTWSQSFDVALPLPPGEDMAVVLCSPSLGTSRHIVCLIQLLYSAFSSRFGYLVQSSQAQKTEVVYSHEDYPKISL